MSMRDDLPLTVTLEVRDRCLCLHVHRAARVLARRFDDALRAFGLTHGQFSLLMSLNRPFPPTIGEVAQLLAMDRTTLTANLKPLERRKLLAYGVQATQRLAVVGLVVALDQVRRDAVQGPGPAEQGSRTVLHDGSPIVVLRVTPTA